MQSGVVMIKSLLDCRYEVSLWSFLGPYKVKIIISKILLVISHFLLLIVGLMMK